MTDSPEYKTLLQCNQKLRSALQLDVVDVSARLFAAGLISEELHSYLISESRSSSERTARLVHFITQAVKVDPSKYASFVDILRHGPYFYSEILQILSDTYSNILGM